MFSSTKTWPIQYPDKFQESTVELFKSYILDLIYILKSVLSILLKQYSHLPWSRLPPLKYFCWHKASFVWGKIKSAINCLCWGDMSQWGTLSCWENSIIQHKTSQWSHFSFHSRIILGLCEKLPVEKRDLTTGKLNIKPSARAPVFTSDLYVNTQTHIEYIEKNILDKKVSRAKNNYQMRCTMLFTILSKPSKCNMKSWFHCNAWHWHDQAGGVRLWGSRASQSLPRSTTAPLEESRGPRYCRPHPRAFHK